MMVTNNVDSDRDLWVKWPTRANLTRTSFGQVPAARKTPLAFPQLGAEQSARILPTFEHVMDGPFIWPKSRIALDIRCLPL
jgi:hypothetical protein